MRNPLGIGGHDENVGPQSLLTKLADWDEDPPP
jgi:hypothetical protein